MPRISSPPHTHTHFPTLPCPSTRSFQEFDGEKERMGHSHQSTGTTPGLAPCAQHWSPDLGYSFKVSALSFQAQIHPLMSFSCFLFLHKLESMPGYMHQLEKSPPPTHTALDPEAPAWSLEFSVLRGEVRFGAMPSSPVHRLQLRPTALPGLPCREQGLGCAIPCLRHGQVSTQPGFLSPEPHKFQPGRV